MLSARTYASPASRLCLVFTPLGYFLIMPRCVKLCFFARLCCVLVAQEHNSVVRDFGAKTVFSCIFSFLWRRIPHPSSSIDRNLMGFSGILRVNSWIDDARVPTISDCVPHRLPLPVGSHPFSFYSTMIFKLDIYYHNVAWLIASTYRSTSQRRFIHLQIFLFFTAAFTVLFLSSRK